MKSVAIALATVHRHYQKENPYKNVIKSVHSYPAVENKKKKKKLY